MWKVALVCFLFTWTLTTHGKYSASGDEPHYLMVTQSLLRDHDLDLANNYAHDDGRWFGHDHLEPGPHARIAPDGRLLSVHDVGLPVLLTPLYAVAQRVATVPPPDLLARFRMSRGLFAYSIVSIGLLIAMTWALTLLAEGLAAVTTPRIAALLVITIGISPPVVSHSFLVFPEVPAFIVAAVVVWFLTKVQEPADHKTMLWIIAAVGFLPWAHRKYSLFALGLMFALLWEARRARAEWTTFQRWLAAALFVVPQTAFYAWTWYEWGTVVGPQLSERAPFAAAALKNGIFGLWIDRQAGLLAFAPFYWLVPVSFAAAWRRTWPLLVPLVLLYLPMAAFVEWWGGFSPAARYLVPIVPLCAVPMALALRTQPIRITAAVLAIAQLAIDAAVWQHPRMLWPQDSGANAALESLGAIGRSYEQLLPSIQREGVTIAAVAIAIALSATLILIGRYSPPEQEIRL